MSFFAVAGGRKVKERKATTLSLCNSGEKARGDDDDDGWEKTQNKNFRDCVSIYLYIYICVAPMVVFI